MGAMVGTVRQPVYYEGVTESVTACDGTGDQWILNDDEDAPFELDATADQQNGDICQVRVQVDLTGADGDQRFGVYFHDADDDSYGLYLPEALGNKAVESTNIYTAVTIAAPSLEAKIRVRYQEIVASQTIQGTFAQIALVPAAAYKTPPMGDVA